MKKIICPDCKHEYSIGYQYPDGSYAAECHCKENGHEKITIIKVFEDEYIKCPICFKQIPKENIYDYSINTVNIKCPNCGCTANVPSPNQEKI